MAAYRGGGSGANGRIWEGEKRLAKEDMVGHGREKKGFLERFGVLTGKREAFECLLNEVRSLRHDVLI